MQNQMKKVFLYFICMFVVLPTHADESCGGVGQKKCLKQHSKEYVEDPCNGTGALEQGECAQQKFSAADKRLNDLYKQLMAALPPDSNDSFAKSSLVKAQKAWVKFKEANCDFYGEANGGVQMWKSTYTVFCWADVTEKRANELEEYLKPYKE